MGATDGNAGHVGASQRSGFIVGRAGLAGRLGRDCLGVRRAVGQQREIEITAGGQGLVAPSVDLQHRGIPSGQAGQASAHGEGVHRARHSYAVHVTCRYRTATVRH